MADRIEAVAAVERIITEGGFTLNDDDDVLTLSEAIVDDLEAEGILNLED